MLKKLILLSFSLLFSSQLLANTKCHLTVTMNDNSEYQIFPIFNLSERNISEILKTPAGEFQFARRNFSDGHQDLRIIRNGNTVSAMQAKADNMNRIQYDLINPNTNISDAFVQAYCGL